MRDEFSPKIKKALAERVAWRCSFLGCNRITIGPSKKNSIDRTNLGEAAHIYAASPNGPRFNPEMTGTERKSIENGIWMCRHHARIIDADYTQYSAATLLSWKTIAEQETHRKLQGLSPDQISLPETLIALGNDIVFSGVWKSAIENKWSFTVKAFVIGTIGQLIDFSQKTLKTSIHDFVVIESQGDGRVLDGNLNWQIDSSGRYEIEIKVKDRVPPTDPNKIGGDFAVGEDGDLVIESGDFKMGAGLDRAKQILTDTLSISKGELFYAPFLGSGFQTYYWKYKDDLAFLNRLLKLEVTRLVTIPDYNPIQDNSAPALNFISRILDVQVLSIIIAEDRIPIRIKLLWGNGTYWEDVIKIFINERGMSYDPLI